MGRRGTCGLCELPDRPLTKHHLVPQSRAQNTRVKREAAAERHITMRICDDCHRQLHVLFHLKELALELNTLEKLRAHPAVQRWISWHRKRRGAPPLLLDTPP